MICDCVVNDPWVQLYSTKAIRYIRRYSNHHRDFFFKKQCKYVSQKNIGFIKWLIKYNTISCLQTLARVLTYPALRRTQQQTQHGVGFDIKYGFLFLYDPDPDLRVFLIGRVFLLLGKYQGVSQNKRL